MSLIEHIKIQKNEARKDPNRVIEVNILTLLIGEVETVELRTQKKFSDSQVVDSIKKLIKSNDDSLKHRASEKLVAENAVLAKLLPQQLTEDEIVQIIVSNSLVGIPAVMKFLNAEYAGRFDKGLASRLAK